MPSKFIKSGNNIVNTSGNYIREIHSDNDKCFAVIAKCGHCGDGFYIPIMFTQKCRDRETAVELVKLNARVKRDQKDVILDSFEITEKERLLINAINDHDPYIRKDNKRNYLLKGSMEILERRIATDLSESYEPSKRRLAKNVTDRHFKLAQKYKDYYVLERAYAPRFVGSELIFTNRVNRRELLDEFFRQNTLRYGIRKGNPFFMGLYYQLYGKNNDLGIVYDNGNFIYENDGKRFTCQIPESFLGKIQQSIAEQNAREVQEQKNEESFREVKRVSAIEKFNKRYKKFLEKSSQNKSQDNPSRKEGEPGDE